MNIHTFTHSLLFCGDRDGLVIMAQVDLTQAARAPVGLRDNLVREVNGIRDKDDSEDDHDDVDGDIDVGALFHDGVDNVRALERVSGSLCDRQII